MTQNSNIAEFVRNSARNYPTQVAVIDADRSLTWAELDAQVDAFACGLLQRGLHAGERVAGLLGNSADFVVAYFGILRAGLVAVPLNPAYTAPEIAVLIADSGARLLLVDEGTAATANAATISLSSCEVIVLGSKPWTEILATGAQLVLAEQATPTSALALLLFTAGTSGRPKGGMLTHGALRANVEMIRSLQSPPAVQHSDVVLLVLPMFHVYGLNAVLDLAASAGATCVILDRFDPVGSLEIITKHAVTTVAGAPGMYHAWCKTPGARAALAGVRLFTSGGSPLPVRVFEEFAAVTGKEVFEGYGMTETAPVVATTMVSGLPKAGSVGRPVPGVQVRLVHDEGDDTGSDVEEGDPGEMWVRGSSVFSGYWPDGAGGPDPDGWFRSGDIAFFDGDGDLHIVDRRREVILVNGFNVYPREIEVAIESMEAVAEVAVIGVPDDLTGESVTALVVPMPDATLSVADIAAHCAERVARFKCPSLIRIVDALPHSATGKIAKGRLREVYGDE
ncbi:MAG: hypothetical protein EXQ60_03915 [Candidatus Nanopelagicales bacterium]|nr:hypothetical protein [Candidatus Nanopelagicales bacterium]